MADRTSTRQDCEQRCQQASSDNVSTEVTIRSVSIYFIRNWGTCSPESGMDNPILATKGGDAQSRS